MKRVGEFIRKNISRGLLQKKIMSFENTYQPVGRNPRTVSYFPWNSFLPDEFEGGMKVKKYMSMTKSLRLTASRDLSYLVENNILKLKFNTKIK